MRVPVSCLLVLLVCYFLPVSRAAATDSETWKSTWIGVGKRSTPNQWIALRKVIQLDRVPVVVPARMAADSKYWLWINGRLVVFEGQLKRGPTPQDTYFDTVDLSKHLRQGSNSIAVLLWYFGKHGFSHNSSGKAGFLLDAPALHLHSDTTWKARVHPAYGDTGKPHPNRRLPESNIRFDARKEPLGWTALGYDDSGWPAAKSHGPPPCTPWNRLVARPIPMWKDSGLKNFPSAGDFPRISDGNTVKLRLPYNAQITPYFNIDVPPALAGQCVDIRMDNYLGGGSPNVRAEYLTRPGVQEYESLGWMNGHALHITFPRGVRILGVKYRETGYNTKFAGAFRCDDPFLNQYRRKALRTLYVTMRDSYFDCPDRERAQWWGDLVNEMGEAFYALDTRSADLAKKGILELANWQRPDHTIYSPVPSGNWNKELPMQMLNSVGYYGFWTYYLYTGDLETMRTVYPAVKRYLSIWKIGKNGLVAPRRGGWAWGDWGRNKDMTILYNAWFYLALKGQLNLAAALGETGDIPGIQSRMAGIEQNFNKTFWTGKEYRSPGYKGLTDDRAHALAVVSGLARPAQYTAIREVFRSSMHASPYMEKYVGEALYIMGYPADAIARTKQRFLTMVNHPHSTLWEDWKIGGSGGGTINHAWSGGMLTLLSQYAVGVAPLTPGYQSYQILPQMGPLKHIQTTVPTVRGNIRITLTNRPDTFQMDLTSPANTHAVIGIPASAQIAANGTVVWQNGKPMHSLPGLRFLEKTERYVKFTVTPGHWAFRAAR